MPGYDESKYRTGFGRSRLALTRVEAAKAPGVISSSVDRLAKRGLLRPAFAKPTAWQAIPGHPQTAAGSQGFGSTILESFSGTVTTDFGVINQHTNLASVGRFSMW
jgi:hypothetical protein